MVQAVKADLLGSNIKNAYPNMSKDERQAISTLVSLQKLGKIVI